MRAVSKSETLALSMELRGFGANTYKNMPKEKLTAVDFAVLAVVVVLSTYPFWKKLLLA
jgi:energy-coupling factor transport system permease protein